MIQKYAAALLSIAIVIITALVTIPAEQLTPTAIAQLGILAVGAIVTYLSPLLSTAWAGGLKTGAAVIAAILTGVIPFLTQGYIEPIQILVVVLAALNALAVETGVNLRLDAGRHAAAV